MARDESCPADADGAECTDYPAHAEQHPGLQFRSRAELQLNALWPQNYIATDAQGTLAFNQLVVASRRVGCMTAP